MIPSQIKEIYLDYAASTPVDNEVVSHIVPFFDASFGNPSSLHARGRKSRKGIEDARRSIAEMIGAQSEEIIFTGSGTEANNLAIIGIARAYKHKGNHIIISSLEHKSVMEAASSLESEGFVISIAPVTKQGILDVKECMKLVTERTILISVMLVNNEIGTIQPLAVLAKEIAKIKNNNLPLLHTDACQAITLLPVNVTTLGVDLLTLNSGKVYGPSGVGLLYKHKEITIEPLLVGGGQENNLRAGTENVPSIMGFAKALQIVEEKKVLEYNRLQILQKYLRDALKKRIPQVICNGGEDFCIPSIVHITLPAIEGESMLLMLDHYGICVSTGSACSTNDLQPSHVLMAIGQDEDLVHGSLRISLGRYTTQKEIDYFLEVFPPIVERLTSLSATNVDFGN
jgi:cysteine desulfurase